MYSYVIHLFLYLILHLCWAELPNLMDTNMQKCLNCLCHARTGCWSRINCAKYSINYEYWYIAGSPTLEEDDAISNVSFRECMQNENCILNTIKGYTESFGRIDCNCDGVYDCKDRLSIHLFGSNCQNPKYGTDYAKRYNRCHKEAGTDSMVSEEGSDDCEPEIFD